nr:reverse transcriptase domain-containing protein [Tanacetum cinerariifolium]
MPFGLKNVGATYQCLVDKAFQKQIGRNLEVYVDDLVIKSRTKHEIMSDIEETFRNLREINMKPKPKKCTFGIEEGMFLGYKVNTKGIKKSDFQWTAKAEVAFKQMKQLIAELPTLTAPIKKEELTVYLAAAREAVSAVLMTEREARQIPVYFVSCTLKVKGKILADFIVERAEDDPQDMLTEAEEELSDPWTLFMNGSSCVDGSGAGLILTNPEGVEFTYTLRFRLNATNNEAEYEALIAGLRIVEQIGIKNLQAHMDSRLVANQVNGSYIAKETGIVQYLEKVRMLANNFKKFSIKQVPRSENKKADALRKIASTSFAHLTKKVLVEELSEKSINETEVLAIVYEEGDTWMTPIYNYLTKKNFMRIRKRQEPYGVSQDGPLQAHYVLREIHKRSCSMHAGKRSVVAKALRTIYYWPTMHRDARTLIRACQDCQGIDVAGPFPEGPGKVKFLIVAIDYFTKLVERSNRSLREGIKARLDAKGKDWIEYIPQKQSFQVKIGMPTLRKADIDMVHNDKALEINHDLLEERREQAAIREA